LRYRDHIGEAGMWDGGDLGGSCYDAGGIDAGDRVDRGEVGWTTGRGGMPVVSTGNGESEGAVVVSG
jgi:hypothetical protein